VITCIIIEDQAPAQRILKKYIEEIGSLDLKASFSDALSAVTFLKKEEVDLIFLDIHLPKISGIDFLKTLSNSPQVILTTAFSDYALESYEFNVIDYLLKPFSFQRFLKAIGKIRERETLRERQSTGKAKELFIKLGHELVKLSINDLLYIKSDADYTELYLPGKKYLSSESLRYWEETLAEHDFVRVHKSYVVNTARIEKIAVSQLSLEGAVPIPIGRVYKEGFLERIK
jgi:DNA-binding LytR/AlgR family response regulator